MSKKKQNQTEKPVEVNVQEKGQEKQKVMTKYDRKMEQYKKQQEQEKKEKAITTAVFIVVASLIIAFIASFPIRSIVAKNKSLFTINGEKVTQVEFDYQYTLARTNYLNSYGSYLSMFGMSDLNSIDEQIYDGNMTFKDYFEQLTVEGITNNRLIEAEAKKAGFTYDTAEKYQEMKSDFVEQAKEQNLTLNQYMKAVFGQYASVSALKPFQEQALYVTAYYEELQKQKEPSADEIEKYYQENKDNYDSVDYYVLTIDAELPEKEKDEEGNDIPLADEVIDAAMEKAKTLADSKTTAVKSEGELQEGMSKSACSANIADYVFDASRKAGDTTVIEDVVYNRYQVVRFEKRYLNLQPTVDMYAVVLQTEEENPNDVLSKWLGGNANEDSFVQLAKEYAEKSGSSSEGKFEAIDPASLGGEMEEWLVSADRKTGDTAAFEDENGYGYVFYYLQSNKPVYYQSIKNTLLSDIMSEYMENLTKDVNVNDPSGMLVYLQPVEEEVEENAVSPEESEESAVSPEESEESSVEE